MKRLILVLALILAGCSENLIGGSDQNDAIPAHELTESKLRHPQLLGRDASVSGKDELAAAHLFVAYGEYEADGVTRRVVDGYALTRRVLEEYGVTRRVLEAFGISRRVLEQYGISRRVLESYALTRRVLASYGITADVLAAHDYSISQSLLRDYGTDMRTIEGLGVTRQVIEEYGVTRRVLDDYGISDAAFENALAAWERTIRLKVRIDSARPGIFIHLGTLPLQTFLEEIADDPDIAFVEIDVQVQGPSVGSVTTSTNGAELLPWGVEDIGSAEASHVDPSGVHVYVLDSGVRDNDLNVVERKDFTMLFVNRDQDFVEDSALIEVPYFDPGTAGNPEDETGHGTHVAGTIGALANGRQLVGVAPGVSIHSLKVLTDQGTTDVTTLVAAIDYVIAQKLARPTTPMVLNLSLGMDIGSAAYNVLDEAIQRAWQNNILAVVSAGNSGSDAGTFSPAHVSEALTIGSYGQNRALSPFSNHGGAVDLHAPGDLIPSLSNDLADVANNWAVIESGTSMAAAHVTGAAALVLAEHPQASPARVTEALLAKAKAIVTGVPAGTSTRSVWAGPYKSEAGTDAPVSLELPPFYSFAITSGARIDIYQETTLWSGFEDPSSAGNASVYANEFLDLDNPRSRLAGFSYNAGTYAPGGDPQDPDPVTWASWMEQVPQPNYNPAGSPGNVSVDPIEIPYLDVPGFKQYATRTSAKNLVLSGHYDLGTRENPTVWYVNGNIVTRGDVTFSGFGVFLASGTITINNNIVNAAQKSETMLGLYAHNTITFKNEGLVVAAHVFTNASVHVLRDLTLYGNITAGGNVAWKTQGHNRLYYREPPEALTDIFWPIR